MEVEGEEHIIVKESPFMYVFSHAAYLYTNVFPLAGSCRWTFRRLRCIRRMSTKTSSRKSLSSPASPNTMA